MEGGVSVGGGGGNDKQYKSELCNNKEETIFYTWD